MSTKISLTGKSEVTFVVAFIKDFFFWNAKNMNYDWDYNLLKETRNADLILKLHTQYAPILKNSQKHLINRKKNNHLAFVNQFTSKA